MRGNMIISINPWYYCNFKCDFCYLTKEQLDDKTLLDLRLLEKRLDEVMSVDEINGIDLYGGEIGLLPEDYVEELCAIVKSRGIDDINIITNLSMVNRVITNPDLYVSVSYDFECREQHDRVWDNMFALNNPFSILILASKDLINKDVDEMISQLNLLSNLSSVEIKPYSINQANCHSVSHKDFELFVQKWLDNDIQMRFEFVNEKNIQATLDGSRNAFSNDHVYITPTGQFAVLEFDLNDKEYFKTLDSIQEYKDWALNEPNKNVSDICKSCDYYGTCLTEHYRYVKDLDNGCNGYKGLIDWYKHGRLEDKTRALS